MNITRLNSFITQHLKKIEMLGVLMRIFSFSLVSWFGADSPFLFVWIFNTIDAIIMIAVKSRPSGRGCKAVTRKPPSMGLPSATHRVRSWETIRQKRGLNSLILRYNFPHENPQAEN